MEEQKLSSFDIPTKIEITLYRYNYIDNLVVSALQKGILLERENKDRFSVSKAEFRKSIKRSRPLLKELKKFSNIDPNFVSPSEVNSMFFIRNILNTYNNLNEIVINVSRDKEYTRLIETDDRTIVGFMHRYLECSIDLTEILSRDELHLFNELFEKMDYIKESKLEEKHYFYVDTADFIERLMALEEIDKEIIDRYSIVYTTFFDLIESKVEQDKANLLIITDLDY